MSYTPPISVKVASNDTSFANTLVTTNEDAIVLNCPPGTMNNDGDAIQYNSRGTTVANANAKSISFAINSVAFLVNSAYANPNNKEWEVNVVIQRLSTSECSVYARIHFNGVVEQSDLTIFTLTNFNTTTVELKLIFNAGAIGDIGTNGGFITKLI